MIDVKIAMAKDIFTLKTIDLRSYHYPMTDDQWKHVFSNSGCLAYVANFSRAKVGFAILEPRGTNMRIHRLGVTPKFRGMGVGSALMDKAEELRRATMSKKLEIEIPEIHCIPNDPDNVSLWLKFNGFEAGQVREGAFPMYGEMYDGYIFER